MAGKETTFKVSRGGNTYQARQWVNGKGYQQVEVCDTKVGYVVSILAVPRVDDVNPRLKELGFSRVK